VLISVPHVDARASAHSLLYVACMHARCGCGRSICSSSEKPLDTAVNACMRCGTSCGSSTAVEPYTCTVCICMHCPGSLCKNPTQTAPGSLLCDCGVRLDRTSRGCPQSPVQGFYLQEQQKLVFFACLRAGNLHGGWRLPGCLDWTFFPWGGVQKYLYARFA
jgi:hypothetical protein